MEGKRQRKPATMPAKLAIPVLGKVAPRERLYLRIDEARERPLVWISGPAGAGKTTLAASYLAHKRIKPLWYRLDGRDADPATFFSYMREAVKLLAPRKRLTLPVLAPDYVLGLPAYTHNFFEQLFSRLTTPAVVVLDNFHELADDAPLQRLLPDALSWVPAGVTVLILSRNTPPAGFAGLTIKQSIAHIGQDDLALTLEDAHEIARLSDKKTIPPSVIDAIHARARGWSAGFIAMLDSVDSEDYQHFDIPAETRETLFNFFANELFERSKPMDQWLLVATALLPQIGVNEARLITGNADAGARLAELAKRNYFMSRLSGDEPRYQYHPLFREFLLSRGPATLRDEWPALKRSAVEILAAMGMAEEAVVESAALHDWDKCVSLVLQLAPSLAADGRFATLRQWIERLPERVQQENPWLLYWLGHCHMVADFATARMLYEQAYRAFRKTQQPEGAFLAWAGIVDTILNALDSFRELDAWIDSMDELTEKYGQPDQAIACQVAPRMFGALVMRRPQHPKITEWRSAAIEAFRTENNVSLKLLTGFYLFATAVWAYDLRDAEELLAELRIIGETPNALPTAQIVRALAESWRDWLQGRSEESLGGVETGLALGEQTGIHVWDMMMLIEGAVAALTAGNLQTAGEFLARIEPVLPLARRWDKAYYYHESGWRAALAGDIAEATRLQRSAVRLIAEMAGIAPEAEIRVGLAQACALSGEREERERELSEARRLANLLRSPLLDFTTAFVGAAYALADGDTERARSLTEHAMQVGAVHGYKNFTWWLPQQAATVCAFALEQMIETSYVHELIKTRNLIPSGELWRLEAWPWHIKIYTHGRFVMLRDNELQVIGGKALAMLKAVIALGGRDVDEAMLCEVLWPEADGDQAHQNLTVTLHRLRKYIGNEALGLHEGRLYLNPRLVWVDAWALERLLGVMNASGKEIDSEDINQAIKLYNDGFMASDSQYWVLAMRERLRSKFLRAIGRSAERLCEKKKCKEALQCYQKAIEVDHLAERFYQGLLHCYQCLKQPAEGLAVYNNCRAVLERELGISPSEKTELLHAQLRDLTT